MGFTPLHSEEMGYTFGTSCEEKYPRELAEPR
jgi:hypothetical protein